MFRVFEEGVPFTFTTQDPDDTSIGLKVNEKWFTDESRTLRELYFISVGAKSYGNLIQRKNKTEFLERVERFKTILEAYSELVRDNLKLKMQETRDSLVRSLLLRVEADPPKEWKIKSPNVKLTSAEIRFNLEREIDQAFGRIGQAFGPKVVCLFKGVRYETIIEDKLFRNQLVESLGEEGAAKLLSEYTASRAEPANASKT